jgi:HEPN/RES N-terminal domain 1/RES domain
MSFSVISLCLQISYHAWAEEGWGNLVGYAKRMWEEEQSRRYHTSNDAVCSKCFDDCGIKSYIEDNLTSTLCSICDLESNEPIAAQADGLIEFLLEKVDQHYENAEGSAPWDSEDHRFMLPTKTMSDLIFGEFEAIAGFPTLEWLYAHLKDDITYCQRDWQVMTRAEALKFGWEAFSHAVKYETRFLFFSDTEPEEDEHEPFLVRPTDMLQELEGVIRGCGLIHRVPAATRMFRARGHAPGVKYSTAIDVGPPPQQFAQTAGRMNAPGIVIFYASYERSTALIEATGQYSYHTVAEFELLKDILVVDLTDIPPVPSIFEDGRREALEFLHRFADDVSQPFEPDANIHIEYTPTQVVSEFIRHRITDVNGGRVRGLLYSSAKEQGAVNLALFIESAEIEGVPTESWKAKPAVLRMVTVEEA